MRRWRGLDIFGGTGVRELDGDSARVSVRGVEVGVAGVAIDHEGRIPAALAGLSPEAFSLFLYHYPDQLEALAPLGVDHLCAGHSHGGQIALPFYGALVTLSRMGKRYEWGLYRSGASVMYVNRGIGVDPAIPARIFARPEVTVIEVSGS